MGTILVPHNTATVPQDSALFHGSRSYHEHYERSSCGMPSKGECESGNGQPPLSTWCWKGNKSISSHKPQRCTDETALQGHSKDSKHNFTLWLQVNKHCSGRSPAALQSTTQPAACRLLQPTAVLSAQIITKDRL